MAVRILRALTLYRDSGEGDIKALAGRWQGYFRLRIGEYLVIFSIHPDEITVNPRSAPV
jgi:mRNA-degrading endonuclease RelE of RelBE toxin-antitoxin system